MTLLLAFWTPDRVVQVQALARALCGVLGKDTLLSQCLSPTRVFKWVPANLLLGGNPEIDLSIPSRGE